MLRLAACLALALAATPPAARADVLPVPVEQNEFQAALTGIWVEDGYAPRVGRGHTATRRVLAIGNGDIAMLAFGGVPDSALYSTSTVAGSWTAERIDATTIRLKLVQSETRGTELTLVFDGPDAFTLTDAENSYLGPSRFTRSPAAR